MARGRQRLGQGVESARLKNFEGLGLQPQIGAHAQRATAATNALDHQADIAKVGWKKLWGRRRGVGIIVAG